MKSEETPRWGSALDAVVVYAQGAMCSRRASGSVPPQGRVRVTGLPRSIDPGSLRARVVGDSGVRVTEVRTEVDAEPSGAESSDALREEVERLRDALGAVNGRRDRLLARIKEVEDLRPVPPPRKRDDPHRRTPAEAWLSLADFVDERLTALHGRLAELEAEVRRVEHELDVAADRLARGTTDKPAAHVETTVCAVLTLDGSGEVELELEYGVPGAVWVPAYRLAYRQSADSGSLVLRASVAQRTGEDWTGVRIALATADLRRRTDLPKLRSLRIGRRQPVAAPSGWREPPAGLSDLFTGYDSAGPRPQPRSGAVPGSAGGAPPAVVGSAPVSPPPPAPSYGGAPPRPAEPGGAPAPAALDRSMPAFGAAAPQAPARARTGRAPAAAPAAMPPAPGGPMAPPPPAPVTGPPRPSGDELDYAALHLSGPDEPASRRGRLFPDAPFDPVAAEHRRRAEAVASLPLPGHAVRPRASAGSFDHRYDAVARADIPSDGTWHTVTISEIPVGLRTEYLCVPSVEQRVYGTLVLSNATDQALLAGPVEVTVDDDFLLTAALPTLAPGGVRRMGLGPAEGVQVTRRTHLNESTAGLRNNVTVLDHRVQVDLANRLARPVSVEVREQVPVTSDPDVRIDERAADWTVPDDGAGPDHHAPGTRVWRVELPPGGTAALHGGYEIRIPAAKALVGGNRRS
ncbi:hypothetical protein BN159_0582 [Streptomyces davaonensis JCM 4913]|uniref:DUF4139 domain-containing protein n=1 Tax=Streptomyces davaonensis (strain DSM 101723 / JCM 4913 / KCC S-0913 / 768) TaxID=1214101 RepID=K4QSN5_STRDJ|nr:DUF4139 domain-containing protein [Streptomyces davaonensis]CCK24961.1 hypothetical protein BN159_0582 [Streptomyces davaonensis JCM 4913]